MKNFLPRIGFGLVVVLVISAILLSIGQRESTARPSAGSFNPSGLQAFKVLLTQNGIGTRIDRLDQPKFEPKDLVIAAHVVSGPSLFAGDPLAQIENSLERHLKNGGRVLVLPFDADFRASSFSAIQKSTKLVAADGVLTAQVNAGPSALTYSNEDETATKPSTANFLPIGESDESFTAWYKREPSSGDRFVVLATRGPGILGRAADGLFTSNRFLDRLDNAKLALQVVRGMLPEGGRVVFTEASLGEGIEPSLATILGPWASGIWVQSLFLFAVILLTLGIRFGLPEMARRRQSGQREMIDAVSHIYHRAKSTAVALNVAYESADFRIRRGLKLPAHLSIQDRDRLLPATLTSVLAKVDEMRKPIVETDSKGRQRVSYRLDSNATLLLIRQLEAELDVVVPRTRNRIS